MTHREWLTEYINSHGFTRVAEIGLGSGRLFAKLLAAPVPVEVIGVDIGRRPDRLERVRAAARRYPDKARLLIMPSVEAAKRVEDGSLDCVFIDAAHSYRAVKEDIKAWLPKVRPGGHLMGHDFHPKFPGVIKAVTELLGDEKVFIQTRLFVWRYKCPETKN